MLHRRSFTFAPPGAYTSRAPPLLTLTPGYPLSPNKRKKICRYARGRPTSNPHVPSRFGNCPSLSQASAWPNGTPKARRHPLEDRGAPGSSQAEGGRALPSPAVFTGCPRRRAGRFPEQQPRSPRSGHEPPRPLRQPQAPGPHQRCLVARAGGTVPAGQLRSGVAGPPLLTPQSTREEGRGAQSSLECVRVCGRGAARIGVFSPRKWTGVASGQFSLGSLGLV